MNYVGVKTNPSKYSTHSGRGFIEWTNETLPDGVKIWKLTTHGRLECIRKFGPEPLGASRRSERAIERERNRIVNRKRELRLQQYFDALEAVVFP